MDDDDRTVTYPVGEITAGEVAEALREHARHDEAGADERDWVGGALRRARRWAEVAGEVRETHDLAPLLHAVTLREVQS